MSRSGCLCEHIPSVRFFHRYRRKNPGKKVDAAGRIVYNIMSAGHRRRTKKQ